MLLLSKHKVFLYIWYLRVCYLYFTSAGGPRGIIISAVRVSPVAWFILYRYYLNLQFLNHVIIIKT